MVVGALVSKLVQDARGIIAMFDSILQSALQFNYLAVQYTIDGTSRILEIARSASSAATELFLACCNDFDIFIEDCTDWFCEVFESLVETTMVAFHVPIRIVTILMIPFIFLWDIINSVSNFIMYVIGLVIKSAALVGLAVLTTPSELTRLSFNCTLFLLSCLKSSVYSAFAAFTTVPKEAYLGLTITTGLIFTTKWVIKRYGMRAFRRFAKRTFKYVVTRTKILSSRIVAWFRDKYGIIRRGISFRVPLHDNATESDTETSDVSVEEVPVQQAPLDVPMRRMLTRAALRQQNEAKAVLEELNREREAQLCVVCQDERKSVAIMPCRHMCLCEACATTLRNRDPFCPMCRGYMRDIIHLYSY